MKKMFSYVTICLFGIIVFALNSNYVLALHNYTNYYGVEMTTDEYATLLNLGFNNDEIHYMSQDTFDANKDLDATLLASETKYYKTVYPVYGNSYTVEVTENEYFNQNEVLPLDIQNTEYKTIVSTISANGNKYRYKISVAWKKMPSIRKYDIIGIGHVDDIHIYNSIVYFAYHYTTSTSEYDSSLNYGGNTTEYGATKIYKLPDTMTGLSSTLYYDVEKDTGAGTLTSLSMCGDYSHATSNSVTSTMAANHSIGYGGIGLYSSIINLYDAVQCTYASVNNISW